jgi:DNA-binding LacI/PurR family transcriptional regulator
MSHIAKNTGLSRYTVSKVLNGVTTVKPEARKKVLDVCEKYGYIPNSNAVGLVKGRTDIIGVIVPFLTDDFYTEFIEMLDQAAGEHGYQLLYRSSYNDSETESNIIKNFLALNVCAMIIVPVITNVNLNVHKLACKNIPVVYFDRQLNDDNYHVINDNNAGMFEMTELMISRKRTPVYLGSFYHESNITAVLREQGYRDAMNKHKLPVRILDCNNSKEQQDNETFGYENIRKAIADGEVFDALLCVTDAVALGAMRALKEAGIVPGKDVLIAGHDNLRFSAFLSPSLSTVRQRKDLFAQTCIKIINDCLHDKPPVRKKYMFAPEIICRESV